PFRAQFEPRSTTAPHCRDDASIRNGFDQFIEQISRRRTEVCSLRIVRLYQARARHARTPTKAALLTSNPRSHCTWFFAFRSERGGLVDLHRDFAGLVPPYPRAGTLRSGANPLSFPVVLRRRILLKQRVRRRMASRSEQTYTAGMSALDDIRQSV